MLVGNDLGGDVRSVGFAQHFAGRPVLGGQVSFRFKRDRLIALGSEALPDVSVELASKPVAAAEAQARARAWIVAEAAGSATAGAVDGPFILPVIVAGQRPRYHEVLRVIIEADAPIGRFAVYVDAGTGRPIAREQLLHFATGTVQFRAPLRGPKGPRVDLPATLLNVFVNGAASTTDAAGNVTIPDGQNAALIAGVAGAQVHVLSEAGPSASKDLSLAPGGVALWADLSEQIEAQLSAYVHAGVVKQRVRSIAPDFAYLDQDLQVTVNINDICNAFSDGDAINFFQSGSGCENTALISDVVYHEFGHSVHVQGLIPGVGLFEGALSEGVSDYLSATITDDAGVARGFFLGDPNEPLRELDPDGDEWRWPDDVTGAVHDDGRIIGGALWDLRTALVGKLGPAAGVAQTDKIWFESIRRAVDIPSMYPEALVVDDDDGDLANGTPNECEINLAFAAHGLLGAAGVSGAVTLLDQTEAGTPVRLSIVGGAKACVDLAPTGAELRVRLPGANAFETLPMSPEQGGFLGLLPNFADGTLIEYQVGVTFTDASTTSFPQNPADPWYQRYFGGVTVLACTGFEAQPEAEGWQLGGEWQWGAPTGQAGDPLGPFGGAAALGVNLNGAYLSSSTSTLESPAIPTLGFPTVRLQYRRWLNIEDGFFDQATISVNETLAWSNFNSNMGDFSTVAHRDEEWRFHDVDISDLVVGDQVQIEFKLQSDPGLELGGWTIDELCVVGTDLPPPPVMTCGDGVQDPGEGCDGGVNNSDTLPGACRTNCLPARCGDLVVDQGELCDDGGVTPGDGCSATCQTEGPSTTTDVPTTSAGDDAGDTSETDEASGSSGLLLEGELADRGCACDARGPRDLHGLALGLLVLAGLRPRRRHARGA